MLATDEKAKQARVFVIGKPFQPGLTFGVRDEPYSSGVPFRCTRVGSWPYSVRPGWEDLPRTNNRTWSMTKKKKFYNIDTWWLSSPSSHSLVRKLVVGLGACMVLARRMDFDIGTPPRPAKSKSCTMGGTATGTGSRGQRRQTPSTFFINYTREY
jgi:hypothetical protein